MMLTSISSMFKGRTLLHMGCKDCGKEETHLGVKVLNKLGLDVEVADLRCGCEFYGLDEARMEELIAQNRDLLAPYGHIIVGCARCHHMLKTYCGTRVSHISQVIHERLKAADPRTFNGSGDVYYHDPCYLTRFQWVVEEPREVLGMLGYTVREFENNLERTDCCGDYSSVRALRERGAELRLTQLPTTARVTSACPKCTQNLSGFNKTNSKITVEHFLDMVDSALNIRIPDRF